MLHKISDFCDKIDSIKKMSDTLRKMKYGTPKASRRDIDTLIETIQADCLAVSIDKSKYWKPQEGNVLDTSVMSPEEEREWKWLEKSIEDKKREK
jgi:hypothetical protein